MVFDTVLKQIAQLEMLLDQASAAQEQLEYDTAREHLQQGDEIFVTLRQEYLSAKKGEQKLLASLIAPVKQRRDAIENLLPRRGQ